MTLDQYRTLLLDASYRPIRVISWMKAVVLSFQGKILVVETYDQVIRSVSVEVLMPSVVALKRYFGYHPVRIRYSKRNVFLRDGHRCQYCGEQPGASRLTIDHVIPQSRGGRTKFTNVVTACERCNLRKGNRTPEEAGMRLLSVPGCPEAQLVASASSPATPPEWLTYLGATG